MLLKTRNLWTKSSIRTRCDKVLKFGYRSERLKDFVEAFHQKPPAWQKMYNIFKELQIQEEPVPRSEYGPSLLMALHLNKPEEAIPFLKDLKERQNPRHISHAIIECEIQLNQHDEAIQTLNQMQAPCITSFNLILKMCWKTKKLDEAVLVYERMHSLGIEPEKSTRTPQRMISHYINQNQIPEARALLTKLEKKGLFPEIKVYEKFIVSYLHKGQVEEAESILSFIESKGLYPSVNTYTFLISFYGKSKRNYEARAVFDSMEEKGIFPSGVTYTTLISMYLESNQPEEVELLLKRMEETGTHPNLRVLTLAKLSRFDESLALLKSMIEEGIDIDSTTFDILIRIQFSKNRLDEVEALFRLMHSKGVLEGDWEDVEVKNALIGKVCGRLLRSYLDKEKVEEAEWFRQLMESHGVFPSLAAYGSLFSIYKKLDKIKEARSVFDAMGANGRTPTVVHYSMMISMYTKMFKIQEAEALFSKMEHHGVIPTPKTFTPFIKLHAKLNQEREANEILARMEKRRVLPTAGAYSALLAMAIKMERVNDAKKYFEKIESLGEFPNPVQCESFLKMLKTMQKRCEVEARHVIKKLETKEHLPETELKKMKELLE